jgi:hypothetical protein
MLVDQAPPYIVSEAFRSGRDSRLGLLYQNTG